MRLGLEKLLEELESLGGMEDIHDEVRKVEEAEGFILFEKDDEVTNEKILSFDLVGVMITGTDGKPLVNIIKNKLNGIVGVFSFDRWLSLIEDKVDLNRRNRKAKDEIPESTENTVDFDEVFADLSKLFRRETVDNIRPKAEKLSGDISSGVLNIFSAVEEAIQDIQPKVKEVKETVQDKGLETAKILKLKIRIAKLQAIKAEAISEEVATKKFIKKIDEKIDEIQSILGN